MEKLNVIEGYRFTDYPYNLYENFHGTDYNTPNLGLYCFDSRTTEIADILYGTNGKTPVGGGLVKVWKTKLDSIQIERNWMSCIR
ncbi:MAG: hypothetical protein IPL23_13355 [Saprospiraceae bacterium]|nr:hypothetical protein [Saprospiraceae bacterium]